MGHPYTMRKLIGILLMLVTFIASSCNKKDSVDASIVGSWMLMEQYSGFANGGNFLWNEVAIEHSKVLYFAQVSYMESPVQPGAYPTCSGEYQRAGNTLQVKTDCNTLTEEMTIKKLTTTQLILERTGREGQIQYKYRKFSMMPY